MSKALLTLLILLFLFSFSIPLAKAAIGEIDKIATVTSVLDGDTFDIASGERIRLADIDTPEINETGYVEATNFLKTLIEGKTIYLDIDNKTTYDPNGRLVCVAYVSFNSTHYENVNKALLEGNYAVPYEFSNNDFNHSDWSVYIQKTAIPEFPSWTIVPLITLAAIAALACARGLMRS